MGITISERYPINLIDVVDNNYFLKGIYPLGLSSVFIGQFGLDQTQFSLNFHVYEKPEIEVKKWGVWGINYNVIVIHMLGANVGDIKIQNWDSFTSAPLICWSDGRKIFISCNVEDQIFEISCSELVFQNSSTYILSGE